MRRIVVWLAGVLAAAPLAAQEEERADPAAGPRVSLQYEQSRFDREIDPWHLASLEVGTRGARGTVLLRATTARRFGQGGRQVELDAYPRLTPGVYGYLNLGYSPDEIFPRLRLGAELFGSVGGGVELSAGARRLDFAADELTLYTGSVGVYRGNYYLVARPFLSRDGDGTSTSGTVMVRRYLRDAEEWVALRLGAGATPAEELTTAELERLSSLRLMLEGRRPVGAATHLRLSAGAEREELPGGRNRARLTLGIGVERRF